MWFSARVLVSCTASTTSTTATTTHILLPPLNCGKLLYHHKQHYHLRHYHYHLYLLLLIYHPCFSYKYQTTGEQVTNKQTKASRTKQGSKKFLISISVPLVISSKPRRELLNNPSKEHIGVFFPVSWYAWLTCHKGIINREKKGEVKWHQWLS